MPLGTGATGDADYLMSVFDDPGGCCRTDEAGRASEQNAQGSLCVV
jgi:hypothetical protein